MITIFHGDNTVASRDALNQYLDSFKGDVLRIDNKQIDINKINNYLEGQSLFGDSKMLSVSNYFSIPKANSDKISKIFNKTETNIIIWQDKKLNATQLKIFPKAKINIYNLDKIIYKCLNEIKPHNLKNFLFLFRQCQKKEPFDLIFFWIKFSLRRQLQSYSKFPKSDIKKTYLQLIELDYQNKNGTLTISREIALIRIMSILLS